MNGVLAQIKDTHVTPLKSVTFYLYPLKMYFYKSNIHQSFGGENIHIDGYYGMLQTSKGYTCNKPLKKQSEVASRLSK